MIQFEEEEVRYQCLEKHTVPRFHGGFMDRQHGEENIGTRGACDAAKPTEGILLPTARIGKLIPCLIGSVERITDDDSHP